MYLSALSHPAVTRPPVNGVQLSFGPGVAMREVQDTLDLARLAAESLHGAERVELEARLEVDPSARTVAVDTGSRAGRTLAIVFLGLVKREFGPDAVRVRQLRPTGAEVAG